MNKSIILIGLVALSLLLSACGLNVNMEDGELVVNSNFTITEEMLNSGETTALTINNVDLIENASFDLQPGQVVINGDILCENDSRQEGSITLAISTTETGFVDVEISEVASDCDGVESGLVETMQTEMEDSLTEAARELQESEASLTFEEITITDDSLTIALEVRVPMDNQ